MNNTYHAAIDAFLQQQTISQLWQEVRTNTSYQYNKSGVVPFICTENGFEYYVMKPCGTVPDLGEASFQLCKGTRQYQDEQGAWLDIRSQEAQGAKIKETLAATALREGIEELGLELENIGQLWDMGAFSFSSATTGKTKYMWLFASEIHKKDRFLPDGDVAESTAERLWVDLEQFRVVGRPDHVYVLSQIESSLRAHFNQ